MSNWNPEIQSELDQSLVDVASYALEQSKNQGATMADISIGQGQGMSVTVRQGEVETVEHNRDKSIGVTVYFGHRCGNASSTDFSDKAIQACVESACNIAKYTEEDTFNGLADIDMLATEFPDLDLNHPWAISMDQAIEIASRCETAAIASDSKITNTEGATVSSHDGVDLTANSHGFIGFSRGSRHSTSCSLIAGSEQDMHRDHWYDSKRHADDLQSPESIGIEAATRAARRLGARKIKTGEYPVIFEPSVSSSLFSHLVSAISGSSLYRKASFLLDQKGQAIFPENVQAYEQPHLTRGTGSAVFDNEGVATQANQIVRNGVLENYLLGSYSARKLGMKTTGNAGGIHNLTIDATFSGGVEAMAKEMSRGLVVTELIGFGVNTVTGDYSRGAFGFWIENGEIQFPVQELTIAGNLKEMFSAMTLIGSDFDDRKNVRVGSVMIDHLTVAGE